MKKILVLVIALLTIFSVVAIAETSTDNHTCLPGKNHEPYAPGYNDEKWEDVASTCTRLGHIQYTCQHCGKTIKEYKDSLAPHTPKTATPLSDVAPKCEEAGKQVYDKCTVCGATNYEVVIPATGHSWATKVVAGVPQYTAETCIADAYETQECSKCKGTRVYTYENTKLGHEWYLVAADDVNDTEDLYYVGSDGYLHYRNDVAHKGIKAGDKVPNFKDMDVLATCSSVGVQGEVAVCTRKGCGTWYNGKDATLTNATYTEKVPHAVADYVVGYDKEKGTVVSVVDRIVLDALKNEGVGKIDCWHTDAKGKNAIHGKISYDYKAATCTEDGHIKLACSKCAWTFEAVIKAEGHFYTVANIEYLDNKEKIRNLKVVIDLSGFDGDYETISGEELAQFIVIAENIGTDLVEKLMQKVPPMYRGEVNAVLNDALNLWWSANYLKSEENRPLDCTMNPIVTYECFCGSEKHATGWAAPEHRFHKYAVLQQKAYDEKVWEYDWDEVAECTDYVLVEKCDNCMIKRETPVEGKGHKLTIGGTKLIKETCTKTGLQVMFCEYDNCDYNKPVDVKPHNIYNYPITVKEGTTVPATCTVDGSRVIICGKCEEEQTEIIPAPGHNYIKKITKVATCTQEGEETSVCHCGAVEAGYPVVIPHAHEANAVKSANNANVTIKNRKVSITPKDCTKEASASFYCTKCCAEVVLKIAPKAAHTLKAIDSTKVTTYKHVATGCEKTVSYTNDCKFCDHTEPGKTVTIEKHVWDEENFYGQPDEIPTCVKAGSAWYGCENCGEYYQDTLPAFGHEWETTWDEEEKEYTYTCWVCGEVVEATIDAPEFKIDLKNITEGKKVAGTGKLALAEDYNGIFTLSDKFVYVRLTYIDANGQNWVFDLMCEVEDDMTFDVSGIKNPTGTKLSEALFIVTDDANADEDETLSFNMYGVATL